MVPSDSARWRSDARSVLIAQLHGLRRRGMDHRPHIVVVEDETTQRQLLVDYLTRQNFRVSGTDGGTALRKLVEREMPTLVLLDVGLPGEDGFALGRWLRERSGRIGIIMVTAASDTVDRVVGLETGADDYIGKPFDPRELLARVKSVLRRVTGGAPSIGPRVRLGRRILDLEKRVLVDPRDGSEETLTASEYDLLRVFAENPNRPLNRDWLLEVTSHREMEAFDRSICGLHGCAARSRSIRVGLRPSALCGASATCSCRRGIETKFDVVSDASIQRAINLGQRAAQLARQRSKALAAGTVVASFAGALEQCSCSGDPRGADRLGGSLEFVSRGCEGRKIARAGAGFDHALALDRGVAKLPQKGIDRGLVTEPIGQNSAVDGSDRVRLGVTSFWLAFAAVDG